MKNTQIIYFFIFFLSIIPLYGGAQTTLSMDWVINPVQNEQGLYTDTIRLVNQGTKSLEKDWTLYFCAFTKKFQFAQDAPIQINRIAGTYHKIVPTVFYKPLQPGDTLLIPWTTPTRHSTISFAPSKAYLVEQSSIVGEQQPVPVMVRIIYHESLSAGISNENATAYWNNRFFQDESSLSPYDIVPALKSVRQKSGSSRILSLGADVKLVCDPSFEAEGALLAQQLSQQVGCRFSNQASTCIHLLKDEHLAALHPDAYQMDVRKGMMEIRASSSTGVFYGCQTLLSILSGKKLPMQLPFAQITDYPDLAYRGLMLDVSRNFTTKEHLLQLIDVMASYKMNQLHLHLSDDEGWRLEIPGLEELTQVGSRRGHTSDEINCLHPTYFADWNPADAQASSNGFYTRRDFMEILRYADRRHIRVIPEIDLPGHARAAIVSMKARYRRYESIDSTKAKEYLLSEWGDTSRYISGQGYRDNVINVALPSTYRFIRKVMDEIRRMYLGAGLKLDLVHVGGDEVAAGAWSGSPACQKWMQENELQDARGLKNYFLQQVISLLEPMQIRLAGWQEVILKPHSAQMDPQFISQRVVGYCWNTIHDQYDEMPYVLANAGYDVVLSNASNFYLDFAYDNHFYEPGHNWGGYVDELQSFDAQPFYFYHSMREKKENRRSVSADTTDKVRLTALGRKHVLGMQAQLWCETVGRFDQVSYYLFPKILGLVERCWNSEPLWGGVKAGSHVRQKRYEQDLRRFNEVCNRHELPHLHQLGVNFRICEPALMVEEGMLYANCRNTQAEIHYTLDGEDPTLLSPLWKTGVPVSSCLVKAKTFYLGKQSVTTLLRVP